MFSVTLRKWQHHSSIYYCVIRYLNEKSSGLKVFQSRLIYVIARVAIFKIARRALKRKIVKSSSIFFTSSLKEIYETRFSRDDRYLWNLVVNARAHSSGQICDYLLGVACWVFKNIIYKHNSLSCKPPVALLFRIILSSGEPKNDTITSLGVTVFFLI